MAKHLGFLLLVIGIVVGCDGLVGAISGRMIRTVPDVGVNQTNTAQALFTREADVLILGSSRANHSFDCGVLEDAFGMSCYNAGRDGQNMLYDQMVFSAYTERHVPQWLILDINGSMLDASWMDNLKEMNCFYGLSPACDQIIEKNATWTERMKLKSSLYRYNNTWQWLLNAHLAADQSALDGYRPMPVNARTTFKASFKKGGKQTVDERCLSALDTIRLACQEKHIRLALTYSPTLVVDTVGGTEDWIQQYADRYGLPFYDYGRDERFYSHPDWFYDMTHLNAVGAKRFTQVFVEDFNNKRRIQ